MAKSDFRFHTSLRVRWMECDSQGIVYNGKYMDYMEIGQSEYFRNLGFSIYRIARRGYFDTATVRALIEYKTPARVDDILDIFVRVTRIGNTSITMNMEVYPGRLRHPADDNGGVFVGYRADSGPPGPSPTPSAAWWTASSPPAKSCPWKISRNWPPPRRRLGKRSLAFRRSRAGGNDGACVVA